MNILISACAADKGESGIGQYMKATVKGLLRASPVSSRFTVYVNHGDEHLFECESPRLSVRTLAESWSSPVANIAWHFFILPFIGLRGQFDLVLFLAANRRLGWIPGLPSIGVLHDLSQLHVKAKYDLFRTFYVLKILTRIMRGLNRVICVSRSTANDLQAITPIQSAAISVIPNGADLERFKHNKNSDQSNLLTQYGLNKPYILYTARLEHPGKNHVRLLEAFSILKLHHDLHVNLVLVGSRWNGAELIDQKIAALNLEQCVIQTGFVSNEDLPAIVANASVFVFPSLYEGFGIPLIEAMATGTPVCAARVASIPEVLGNAGVLFDPNDPQEMAEVLKQILKDPGLSDELIARGRQRASRYTWDRSATSLYTECRRTVYLTQLQQAGTRMKYPNL